MNEISTLGSRRRRRGHRAVLCCGVVLALVAAGCGDDDDEAFEPATADDTAGSAATTEPSATEPMASEPATTEPAATEPAATEPAATEPAATEAPEDEEEVTLTLTALSSYKPGLDPVIAQFHEANPAITVEATYYEAGDAYTTAVPTQFAGGNGSDIVYVLGGQASPYSTTAFARAGYLTDLSDEPWAASMYEPTLPLYQFEDALYARDFGIAPLAVVSYDADYFAENSLEVPTDFAGLIALCGTISETGTTPIAWGGANPAVNANNVATLAGNTVQAEEPDWLAKRAAGETTFAETPGWRRALEQLQEMIDADCFSPGASGMPIAEMVSQFATGQSAMMFTSGILVGQVLAQTPDLNVGMFPAPGDDPATTRVTAQASGGLAINTETEYPDQARRFLEFVSQPEIGLSVATANSIIYSPDAASGTLPENYADLQSYFDDDLVVADFTARWPNTQMNATIGASIQGLFTGQKSIDDVLTDMDAAYELQQ